MAKLLPRLKEYLKPRTIEDAAQLYRKYGNRALILAGGTSLSFQKPKVEAVIDVSGLPLTNCRKNKENELEIGALATIRMMESCPDVQNYCTGLLTQATDSLGNTPLRNLITVGGNICGGFSWSDLPVAFMALDAEFESYDGISYQREKITERFDRMELLRKGSLLTRVFLPASREKALGKFIKFMKTEVGFGMVTLAISYFWEDEKIKKLRVACGCITNAPVRLDTVEQPLENTRPDRQQIQEISRAASEKLSIKPDSYIDERYRRSILATLIERAFLETLER